MTRDDIHQRIVRILHETFGIASARVTLDAHLYDDLDIDSIDAIDLVVQLKTLVGKRMAPEAFKTVRTVGDIVEAVHGLVNDPPLP